MSWSRNVTPTLMRAWLVPFLLVGLRLEGALVSAFSLPFSSSSSSSSSSSPVNNPATRLSPTFLSAVSSDGNSEEDLLLEKARLLREEAQTMEQKLRETKPLVNRSSEANSNNQPITVIDLKDSQWTISYRFSSQPKDDDNGSEKEATILPNYSGKLGVLLKGDGYSELVSQADGGKLKISKIWGWDEEFSQEDDQQYVLFSMDVIFPDSDPKLPNTKERCYYQARIDRSTDGAITLGDGTVTVKKDISEKTGGMWGLFQVAGILTQFRYVGDFIAKPSSKS